VTGPPRGVLDTSVFIASESGRALDEAQLPEEAAISVITLAELHVGVLAARDTDTRSRRLATLNAVADIEVLPVDEAVALQWARLRVQLAEAGRRVNVNDLWIAATAVSRDLPVVTQDADYEPLQALGEVTVLRV
jgi:predicted nucleic acid-binding protein